MFVKLNNILYNNTGSILTFQSPRDYKQAQAYTLAQDYGFTRIMSSYDFGTNTDQGPPSDANGRYKSFITFKH